MNRPGAGPAPIGPLRSFGTQESLRSRNPPSTSRVTNGKLGNSSGWNGAFGMPTGGAPGLQDLPQRSMVVGGAMGAFGQTVGSQPATPLDPSEFPSLSGSQQTQQNSGQAIWGQRPSQAGNPRPSQQHTSLPKGQLGQSGHNDLFSASQFQSGANDFGPSNQAQGSIDDFPPLGRESSSGLRHERRGSLLQNSAFGNYGTSMAFASMTPHQGNPLSSGLDRERMTSPAAPGAGVISSRPPNPPGQNGSSGADKVGTIGSGVDASSRSREMSNPPALTHASNSMMNSTFGGNEMTDSPSSMQPTGSSQSLENMSEGDRFGLPGLLAAMRHPSADLRTLSGQGQDLTNLGLDLASNEHRLHSRIASIFDPGAQTRVPMDSDFTLPSCYKVANVQPLGERIPSFSEETLFFIFYSNPKDLVQEMVAEELVGRKWRFHRVEKMWVTRDENFSAPVEMEREVSEQGSYLWWDWRGWKKVRRTYLLRYEDLDNGPPRRPAISNPLTAPGPGGQHKAMAQGSGLLTR